MPRSHQNFRPVLVTKLLGIVFMNRCWVHHFSRSYNWRCRWLVWKLAGVISPSHWLLLATSVGISGCNSVKSVGPASDFQHNPQQFHGWNGGKRRCDRGMRACSDPSMEFGNECNKGTEKCDQVQIANKSHFNASPSNPMHDLPRSLTQIMPYCI